MQNTRTILIASAMAPNRSAWPEFARLMAQIVRENGATCGRIGITDGPGASNLTIELLDDPTDDLLTSVANVCTLALMPARWTTTQDTPLDGYHITAPELQD